MEATELDKLLATDEEYNLGAKPAGRKTYVQDPFLPVVSPFGETYLDEVQTPGPSCPPPRLERVNLSQPSLTLSLFSSLDADLRSRIKAVASSSGPQQLDANKALMIGDQLCFFASQCDLTGLSEPDNPNSVAGTPLNDLLHNLGLVPDSQYVVTDSLQTLIAQETHPFLIKALRTLLDQVSGVLAESRSKLESLNICLTGFTRQLEFLRSKYLSELTCLSNEIRISTKEETLQWAKGTGQMLIRWFETFWGQTDSKLLAVLAEIQTFCPAVINVLRFKLSMLRELEHKEPTDSRASAARTAEEQTTLKQITTWGEFLQRTLTLEQYVRVKPCTAPDVPGMAALQHCIVTLDHASGISPSRNSAFATAKLLLADQSVVAVIEKLLLQVQKAYAECRDDITKSGKQFEALNVKFHEQFRKQNLLVSQLQKAFQISEQDSNAIANCPDSQLITSEQLARHMVILKRQAELKPQIEREQLALNRINDSYRRVSALAASQSMVCPSTVDLEPLKAKELQARERIKRLSLDSAGLLEKLQASASKGQSTQVDKTLDECLTRLNHACVQRDRAFLAKSQQISQLVQRSRLKLKRTQDLVIQWCVVNSSHRSHSLRPQLLRLDVCDELRKFVETRANLLISLHLFHRIRMFHEWATQDV